MVNNWQIGRGIGQKFQQAEVKRRSAASASTTDDAPKSKTERNTIYRILYYVTGGFFKGGTQRRAEKAKDEAFGCVLFTNNITSYTQ